MVWDGTVILEVIAAAGLDLFLESRTTWPSDVS